MKAHKIELKALSTFPRSWKDPVTGMTYPRLALEQLPNTEQEALGWYEVADTPPTLLDNQRAVKGVLEFDTDTITQTYTIADIYTPEQLTLNAAIAIKEQKIADVSKIKVTVSTGKIFDGGEVARGRMADAVTFSQPLDTTPWILADNSTATVTREELQEAGLLAGQAMTTIWVT